jgi:predicted RNA-binding Zn-ribbon protein involved in translation (DUF1610 family)
MLKPGDELHVCPACGYALGFHTSFISANITRDNPIKSTRDVHRVILICPNCGARFDIGWRVSFAEFESTFVKTPVVPAAAAPATGKVPASRTVTPVAYLSSPEGDTHEPPSE